MIAKVEHHLGELFPRVGLIVTTLRRLVLPVAIQRWPLTILEQRLFKTGGRLIRHARYFVLQLADSHLTGTLVRQIIWRNLKW